MIKKWLELSAALLLMGCQSKFIEKAPETTEHEAKIERAASPESDASAPVAPIHAIHDPSNPPIDCPLRKAGLDPTKVKPFEQTEQYIQFLERADREAWQKPDEVIEALSLSGSERIFDLGAGSGYFTFPMAKHLKNGGRIFAGDPEPEMVMHIHHKSMVEGIQNIEARVIDAQKPELPENIDIIFMCDVLHHIADRIAWLTYISNQMKSGSRFYMIEFREGDIPNGPPEQAKIPKTKLIEDATKAGLTFNREIESILPYQYFLEFIKS